MQSLVPTNDQKVNRVHVKQHGKASARRLWWALKTFRAIALVLARAKHFVCFVYFSAISVLYLTAAPHDLRALDAFAPKPVGVGMLCIASLHSYGLVQTCSFQKSLGLKWFGSWINYVFHPRIPMSAKWMTQTSASTGLTLFHLVDVISQSYQAYRMPFYLTNRNESFLFAFVVSMNCLITPWFLFARYLFVRQSLVILVDSYLGFFTSTAFPLFSIIQAFRLILIDRNLQSDEKFVTVSLLIGRYIVVSSPLDLITKFTIQLSSYLSLQRLVVSMQIINDSQKSNQSIVNESTRESPYRASFVKESFRLEFRSRRYFIVYLIANLVWGMSIIISASLANWFREVCPVYCPYDTAPWFDLSCNCAYVEINCANIKINSTTLEALINPRVIGKSVFLLDVRRCDLPHGISLSLLSQFERIYGVFIAYSNLSDWAQENGESFPGSLLSLHIRGSSLVNIPRAFFTLPPGLAFLRLQDSNITYIPDQFFTSWKGLYSLQLIRLALSSVPVSIARMPNLSILELRGNSISYISTEWQDQLVTSSPNLKFVDVSSNKLEHGLWKLASKTRILEMSSNPIATLPVGVDTSLITSRNIIVDDTPLCNQVPCEPKCNYDCLASVAVNHRCDLECFTSECSYDSGYCFGWGF